MRRFTDSVQRSCGIGGYGMRFVDAPTHVTRSKNWEANAGLIKKGLFVINTLQMLTSGRVTHGKIKWIHTVGHPVLTKDGDVVQFLGSSTDITERKQAEQKLQEQEMELRQVLDLTPQLILVFGPNRERLYANRPALDYFGFSLDEWLQRSYGSVVHPDDLERLRASQDRALSNDAPLSKIASRRKRSFAAKTPLCGKRSTKPRCLKRSSGPLPL